MSIDLGFLFLFPVHSDTFQLLRRMFIRIILDSCLATIIRSITKSLPSCILLQLLLKTVHFLPVLNADELERLILSDFGYFFRKLLTERSVTFQVRNHIRNTLTALQQGHELRIKR